MAAAMRRDMMLFAACLGPILAGLFFRFAIPFLEAVMIDRFHAAAIISPYYGLIDVCFMMLSPTMFCFVSAMVTLEEADEKTAAYLFITPLGKTGYLSARFGVPAVAAFLVTLILFPFFRLTVLGAVIPFFIKDNIQYMLFPLPSFWIGKAACENILLYILPAFALSAIWICFLLKRYLRKL